jgi:lambda repressor-like predicted transcriptional regulator
MQLKQIIDDLLKERNRSLSWLAQNTGKTFDGLKLSLTKESLKYSDVKKIAQVLDVSVCKLFAEPTYKPTHEKINSNFEEESITYSNATQKELEACKELNITLKNQLKDKELIIQLLSKK